MKIRNSLFIALLGGTALNSCGSTPNYNVALKTQADTAAYYLGIIQGTEMKQGAPGFNEMNIDAYARGISEAYNKSEMPVQEEVLFSFLNDYMYKAQNEKFEANLQKSTAFLEANKTKEGVVTTESGLQYKILKEGNGARPDSLATVRVHYHGTTIDGDVFDSSVERGEPVEFTLGPGLIAGFNEAIRLMPVGSKWQVFLPTNLAYGVNAPNGSGIQPNDALIFEIELLDIINDK